MPVKKDGEAKRWVEMQLLLPATPEQVWEVMATGPGNAAWFTRAEIEERLGGKLTIDFGKHGSTQGEVLAWEPFKRFAYVERDWAEGAPPVATEITFTARSGGRCVVRMVHSLVSKSDAWDDSLESFESGWPGFFEVLRIHLLHFTGQEAASFMVLAKADGAHGPKWARLLHELGVTGANVGDEVSVTSTPEPLGAVVEHVLQTADLRFLALRIGAPSPGVVLAGTYYKGGGVSVSISRFVYGVNADARARAVEPAWQEWLERSFGASD